MIGYLFFHRLKTSCEKLAFCYFSSTKNKSTKKIRPHNSCSCIIGSAVPLTCVLAVWFQQPAVWSIPATEGGVQSLLFPALKFRKHIYFICRIRIFCQRQVDFSMKMTIRKRAPYWKKKNMVCCYLAHMTLLEFLSFICLIVLFNEVFNEWCGNTKKNNTWISYMI